MDKRSRGKIIPKRGLQVGDLKLDYKEVSSKLKWTKVILRS